MGLDQLDVVQRRGKSSSDRSKREREKEGEGIRMGEQILHRRQCGVRKQEVSEEARQSKKAGTQIKQTVHVVQ